MILSQSININVIKLLLKLGDRMKKDEIIQLHAFLLELKNNLAEITGFHNPQLFTAYDQLQIDPFTEIKSIRLQHRAVFELSKGIAECLSKEEFSLFEKTADRLEKICNRFRK